MDTITEVPGSARTLDPITLAVIRHGVVSIADQIDANITRTAFSPYVYEYKDFAVGLVNTEGHLVAQSTGGMPPFVADTVGTAVRDGLKIYGRERLFEGDIVLVQSICRGAGAASQQHLVMYIADLRGAGPRDLDRLLRHQCPLDRHRRRAERAHYGHLHGGAASSGR